MKAALLAGFGEPLRIADVPRPSPGPGEILIRLEASGVCHTDAHVWGGGLRPASGPAAAILGHEGVGRVAALGPGVSNWRLGERAGAGWLHDACGHCAECDAGAESFCQAQHAHGFDVPGTFAEYVVADSRFAVRLPESGDAARLAPLMCAGVTAWGAVERAGVGAGETCAIFGCGGLGLYAVQIAARRGAKVVAVDHSASKLARARELGATHALVADQAAHWPPDLRAHACINFAPTTATWDAMVAAIRPRGRIVAAAMVPEAVPLSQEWLTATGVTITGTSVGTRAQMEELIAADGDRPFEAEIETIRLDQVSDALQRLKTGQATGRYVVRF